MPDLNKIMQEIPSDYKRQKKINGVLRDTYFFGTWGGYHHPIHMQKPLSYGETQQKKSGSGYYEASLDTSGNNPLLIFVECVEIIRTPISVDEKQLKQETVGDHYYLFKKSKDHVTGLQKEIILNDTFGLREYLHILFDGAGKIVTSEIVEKRFNYSYEYEYDEKGIKRVTVRYPDDTKVIERGQPQVF